VRSDRLGHTAVALHAATGGDWGDDEHRP